MREYTKLTEICVIIKECMRYVCNGAYFMFVWITNMKNDRNETKEINRIHIVS